MRKTDAKVRIIYHSAIDYLQFFTFLSSFFRLQSSFSLFGASNLRKESGVFIGGSSFFGSSWDDGCIIALVVWLLHLRTCAQDSFGFAVEKLRKISDMTKF